MTISENLTSEIKAILQKRDVVAVTCDKVFNLYRDIFDKKRTIVIKASEAKKTLSTVGKICEELSVRAVDRSSIVVAVGGGIVGDVAGFSAAIYLRGLKWISVPTTLLAMCDSGIGGKTGVNLHGYKNMIGAFHQPADIYISTHFIKTLPEREFLCGVGEVIKTAALDKEIFEYFLENEEEIYAKNSEILFEIVKKCAEKKQAVVKIDPLEKTGERKTLNYGHTLGHAFEAADNHKLSHGEYVLHGIRTEAKMLKDELDPDYLKKILQIIDRALDFRPTAFDIKNTIYAAKKDKKNKDSKISIIAVTSPGDTKEFLLTHDEFAKKLKRI